MAKEKVALVEAQEIAKQVIAKIADTCESVVVAGSIRRQKMEVSDVELIIVPRYEQRTRRKDLFEDETLVVNLLQERLVQMAAARTIVPRLKENGSHIAWLHEGQSAKYVAATYNRQMAVDFFVIEPDKLNWYGWHLFLRTGPAEANKALVTERRMGGLLPSGVRVVNGKLFKDSQFYPAPSEKDVFELWGFAAPIPPEERSLERYQKELRS